MQYLNIPSKQRGAALFVSLIMLLLMTMIGLAATRSSNLELIMGTNTQNAAQALLRAENSTLDGEERIIANFNGAPSTDFSINTADGLYRDDEIVVDALNWAALNNETAGAAPELREYIIEYLGPVTASGGSLGMGTGAAANTRYLYRVSGRGSASRGSERVVQTIFATME